MFHQNLIKDLRYMITNVLAVVYVAYFLLYKAVPYFCALRFVDLSHIQNDKSITWPWNPGYNFTVLHRGPYKPFSWVENNAIQMPEHMGTHIDAPAHFYKGGWRQHQIPIERLCGPGVVINVKNKVVLNRDYSVSVEDVRAWERKYGPIPRGAIVMMNSGWSLKYPDKALVFSSRNLMNWTTFHFPGFHADTAQWLINNRDVSLVGSDSPSTDPGQASGTFPAHVLFTKANIILAESVTNLDKIPESGSTIYVPALKISEGSGGPARIFATFDDDPKPNSASPLIKCFSSVLLINSILMSLSLVMK